MDLTVLDDVDKKLIKLLQEDGRKSLVSIGRDLGISHVSVKKRLEKLLSEGIISIEALIASKMFVYAIVIAELEGYEYFEEVKNRLEHCPRMIFLAPLIGGINLIAIMAFEDMNVLESCMTSCFLKSLKGVKRSEVLIARKLFVPTHISLKAKRMDREYTPCGTHCGSCILYKESKCPGCPATRYYKGYI